MDSVLASRFDKLDKIGVEGVKAELLEKEEPEAAVNALCEVLSGGALSLDKVEEILPGNEAVLEP